MEKNGLFQGLNRPDGPVAWVVENRLIPAHPQASFIAISAYPETATGFAELVRVVDSFGEAIRAYVAPYVQALQPEEKLRGAIRDLQKYLEEGDEAPAPPELELGNPLQRSPVSLALDNSNVQDFSGTIAGQVRRKLATYHAAPEGSGNGQGGFSPSETITGLVKAKVERVAVEQEPAVQGAGLAGSTAQAMYVQAITLQSAARRKKLEEPATAGLRSRTAGAAVLATAETGALHRMARYLSDLTEKLGETIGEVASHSPRAYYRLGRLKMRRLLKALSKKFMAGLARVFGTGQKPESHMTVEVRLAASLAEREMQPEPSTVKPEPAALPLVENPRPQPAFRRISGTPPLVNRAERAIKNSQALRENQPAVKLRSVRAEEDTSDDADDFEITRDMVSGRGETEEAQLKL